MQVTLRRFLCRCFKIDGEVGLGARGGVAPLSAELWAGLAFSHHGMDLGHVRLSPGIVIGLSAVTKAMGQEVIHENEEPDGDAHLLFYLGPEIALSTASHPNVELVFRIHHRSGLLGTLGNLRGGHNANTVGLRIGF